MVFYFGVCVLPEVFHNELPEIRVVGKVLNFSGTLYLAVDIIHHATTSRQSMEHKICIHTTQ